MILITCINTYAVAYCIATTGNHIVLKACMSLNTIPKGNTGELGYDGPLYDVFLHMTDNMLGPSPMHIKYSSYVYDGFCI